MKNLLLLVLFSLTGLLFAQNLPVMKTIPGRTVVMGGGYQFQIKDYYMVMLGQDPKYDAITKGQTVIGEVPKENVPSRQISIASFNIATTEVSNAQYREFLIESLLSPSEQTQLRAQLKSLSLDSLKGSRGLYSVLIARAADAGLMPDTNCWVSDFVFAYNEPLTHFYFWHPAFDQYPVVGTSWHQAKSYCGWLTDKVNAQRAAKGLPPQLAYRLPTEMEWEYAAREFEVRNDKTTFAYDFPWKSESVIDEKGRYRANIKTGPMDYIGDNYEYTAPIKSFEPNSKGLYQMAGNVAEWCEDAFRVQRMNPDDAGMDARRIQLFEESAPLDNTRVVKGGSWAELYYAAMSGSRMGWDENKGSSRIGFRVAQSIDGSVKK